MKLSLKLLSLLCLFFLLSSCENQSSKKKPSVDKVQPVSILKTSDLLKVTNPEKRLKLILESTPEEHKSRQQWRNPKETLEFFEVKPGMTVVETYPGGGGWYTQILAPYLGNTGHLIGADYAIDMFPKFGFFGKKFIESKKYWVKSWPDKITNKWKTPDPARLSAFHLGSLPENLKGSADRILFIRSIHNLARFEGDGAYLTKALQDAYDILKPEGILGVVAHMAPEEASDAWAAGQNGYLKKSFVIKRLEEAGFEYLGSSDININLKDKPSEKDNVWRLPPAAKKPKQEYAEIGESTRMTLKFKKPSS